MSTNTEARTSSPQKSEKKLVLDARAVAQDVLEKRHAVFAGLAKR
ncbi:hypothetical protein [Deinococcus metallilatus]|uniref:Uncharacterized protein n=1 Tax=Deinococcus metallilatus TaxID=1211322 RepID=A0ABR6MYQ4_9DEIO|nr:hypothetical protein [Deinococcus metallilatus]MBB5297074.1 hypothetical protein [Deinococcus metallilatus]